MTTIDTPRTRAEDIAARINGSLDWRACDPELRDGVYSGSIILRERASTRPARAGRHPSISSLFATFLGRDKS